MVLHRVKIDAPLSLNFETIESFVNVDSSVVRCLALAVLRQHVALALTLVAVLTVETQCESLRPRSQKILC